jgi:hypothetical protein
LVTTKVRGVDSSYVPRVEYEYSVNGHVYTGKRVAFGRQGSHASPHTEAKERAVVDRYEVGAAVEVFYNPSHATSAVLERRAASTSSLFRFVGIAMIIIAVGRFFLYGFGYLG